MDSVASQPFVTIALRNKSRTDCALRGYPTVAAFGHLRVHAPRLQLAIAVHRGNIIERADPGSHLVVLSPGGVSSFNIGTATAYGTSVITITEWDITVPGTTTPFRMHTRMDASRPHGARVPVRVTALQRGIST